MIDLRVYDWIILNTSAGKDSQTAMRYVVNAAAQQRFPRNRIMAVHADLGAMEWPGTKELVRKHCAYYGLEHHVVKYQTQAGEPLTLLEYIRKRGKWPSSTTRFCTSEFKRGPCAKVITKLTPRRVGGENKFGGKWHVLNVFGFRAEESPARAKRLPLSISKRLSNSVREVTDWLPIHDWTTEQVWEDIKASGVPYHPAYDKGMSRLSCRFCIFAPRSQLIISGRENPELLEQYVAVEKEINHTFKAKESLAEIAAAIAAGEAPKADDGTWNM